mgnify:CR=1 FL=1
MVVRGRAGGIPFVAESSFRDPRGVHVTIEGENATARTGWPWAPDPHRQEIEITSADGSPMDPIVITDGGEKFQLQFESFARALSKQPFGPELWNHSLMCLQAELIERVRAMGGMTPFSSE